MNITLIFLSGVLIGAILETTYRSLSKKRIILPHPVSVWMYGATALFLFFLKTVDVPLLVVAALSLIFTTGVELITFLLYHKITGKCLWDYSKEKWNYKGAICIRFSFYWLAVSLVYYLLILPVLIR